MREKEAADNASNNVTSGKGNINIKCLELSKPCRLKKNDRVAEYSIAAENLSSPDYAILRVKVLSAQ